ncbi:MAG: aminotransferase class V-fold PLP-dependent enzyme, partial [Saprospiraceae bacterium]|nr:aminotransferase class V-fold PLP-dependent enzyme [Saprospiraceae bacterium]
ILTTHDDYVSNQIAFLQLKKRFGVEVVRVRNLASGTTDLDQMEAYMKQYRPRLLAVTHVPTYSGKVQPIEQIGQLCRDSETLYLVDACQSAGQMPLSVEEINCDFLSATFRKFLRGPRGAGFLYVSERALEAGFEPLFLDLHSAEWLEPDRYRPDATARRFELWERPYALLLGAKAAVQYALDLDLSRIEARIASLVNYCRDRLSKLPGIRILDRGEKRCGIISVEVSGWEAAPFKARLDRRGINTSIVYRQSALLEYEARQLQWALRISPHYYNTREEIDALSEAIADITKSEAP